MLLEPQRTNLAIFSEQFDNADWTKINTTVTANTTVSPDGAVDADTIAFTATAGAVCQRPVGGTYESRTHTVSVYARVASGTATFRLKCTHGGVLDYISSDFTATTTWQRFTFSATFGATIGTSLVYGLQNGSNGTAKSVIFYGFQLEANAAYATSYIPTTTAAVTRLIDAFTRTNIFTNGFISAAGGTWFVDLSNNTSLIRDSFNVGLFVSDSSNSLNNSISFGHVASGTSLRLSIRKTISTTNTTIYTTLTDTAKFAIKWNGTSIDVFANGVKVVTASAFTTTNMNFLGCFAGDVPKYINQSALFPVPMTDAQCIQLTT